MDTIDYSNTMALLIGASEFTEDSSINAIPNVRANLLSLKESLLNKAVIGIPESNIFISLNENKIQIERKIYDIAQNTRHKKFTLLVYYTGHGILSSNNYQLYLATSNTKRSYLESDAINIENFKSYIKQSFAGRKIVILDCCHSGAVIGAMGDAQSTIQAGLNGFEGTYVMTSAAEDEPSLFPVQSPELPTYFTGKFLDIVNTGLENNSEYCSLREIFDKIRTDFYNEGIPLPQQSNYNNADQFFFSRNIQFLNKKNNEEASWNEALQKNDKWIYIDFIINFPESKHIQSANRKVAEIDEIEQWHQIIDKNKVSYFTEYLKDYPAGKFRSEAKDRIELLRKKEKNSKQAPAQQAAEQPKKEEKQEPVEDLRVTRTEEKQLKQEASKKQEEEKLERVLLFKKEEAEETLSPDEYINVRAGSEAIKKNLFPAVSCTILCTALIISFFMPWLRWNAVLYSYDFVLNSDGSQGMASSYPILLIPICGLLIIYSQYYPGRRFFESPPVKKMLFCLPFLAVLLIGYKNFDTITYGGVREFSGTTASILIGFRITSVCSLCLFVLAWFDRYKIAYPSRLLNTAKE